MVQIQHPATEADEYPGSARSGAEVELLQTQRNSRSRQDELQASPAR
jgi:hypothetical protein